MTASFWVKKFIKPSEANGAFIVNKKQWRLHYADREVQ